MCPVGAELLARVQSTQRMHDNFHDHASEISMRMARQALYEHLQDVQRVLYEAILDARDRLNQTRKPLPRRMATAELDHLEARRREVLEQAREFHPEAEPNPFQQFVERRP